MSYSLDFDRIKSFVDSKGSYIYRRRNNTYLLPLPTREPERAKFENGFTSIVAAVLRVIDGEERDYKKDSTLFDIIINEGKFDSDKTSTLFKSFLEKEFYEIENANVMKFQHLKYVPFVEDKDEVKGEIAYFTFFYDLFIKDNIDELKEILDSVKNQDILSEIINISLQESEKVNDVDKYKMPFLNLQKTFIEDVKNLSSNPGFLIQNLSDLFVHYCLIAMSQIVLQTNKFTNFDESNLHKIVFILQSERASKWRDSYISGFAMMKDQIKEFFAHEHTLNIVGLNNFSNNRNWFYHDYKKYFEELGPEAQKEFIQSIYQWINEEYAKYWEQSEQIEYSGQNLDEAFRNLYDVVRKNVKEEINSRYPKAFTAFLTRFYRKNGGSLGTILSLNIKQLLLLVAVSVGPKGNRIELNNLWKEFEKRGVALDHISKDEVVQILDNLNYLDKKSDSGDAQYVKSIL